MPVIRTQISWALGSTLPRDLVVITPHFSIASILPDPDWQNLADDLRDALDNWQAAGAARQTEVKMYNMDDAEPRPVKAYANSHMGQTNAGSMPRELAICLSYYSGRNLPRSRGRLYVPAVLSMSPADSDRPSPTARENVAKLADVFANLGGVDIDWVVYSRTDGVAKSVTNAYVDDEWDVVRKRGLKSSARTQRTYSE